MDESNELRCGYFLGVNRQGPCERCAGTWAQHYGDGHDPRGVPYGTAAVSGQATRCYHCANVYAADLPSCPKCGLAPEPSKPAKESRKIDPASDEAQAQGWLIFEHFEGCPYDWEGKDKDLLQRTIKERPWLTAPKKRHCGRCGNLLDADVALDKYNCRDCDAIAAIYAAGNGLTCALCEKPMHEWQARKEREIYRHFKCPQPD